MSDVDGDWSATWAEAKWESYYVTDCSQVPSDPIVFKDVELLTSGDTDYTESISWTVGFETTDDDIKDPYCQGYVRSADSGLEVDIGFM